MYIFVQKALVRKFGQAWFDSLHAAAQEFFAKKDCE
jgi:hypothetical protein